MVRSGSLVGCLPILRERHLSSSCRRCRPLLALRQPSPWGLKHSFAAIVAQISSSTPSPEKIMPSSISISLRTEPMPVSMPASRPAHSWLLPQATLASAPPAVKAHLERQRRHASPIATGLTPVGFLARGTMRAVSSAHTITHDNVFLQKISAHSAISSRSAWEAVP